MRLSISVLALVILVAGCVQKTVAPPPPVYTPPAPRTPITPSMIVSQNFDATWNALVDYVSANSFTIDEFEKESGLLTLSFGTSAPSDLVECGTWAQGGSVEDYINRNLGFRLRTRTNVLVQQAGAGQSRIRANMLYVLKDSSGAVYEFTTNEPTTIQLGANRARGSVASRTCQANQRAEERFLEGIRNAIQ